VHVAEAEINPSTNSMGSASEEATRDAAEPSLAARIAFWRTRDAHHCWVVPMDHELSMMPFLSQLRKETGMAAAIAHARTKGRTALLIDASDRNVVDKCYIKQPGAIVLDVKCMFFDETQGLRTHGKVMIDARKALVTAMKEGNVFYVQLSNSVPHFYERY